jgi:hypothetical protein
MNDHSTQSSKPLDLTPPGKAPKAPIPPGATANGTPKVAKAPKEPKVPKEPRISRFASLYPRTAAVKFLVEGNPKRGASAERYAAYMSATNVGEFLDKGGTYADIAWDVGHGLISVQAA